MASPSSACCNDFENRFETVSTVLHPTSFMPLLERNSPTDCPVIFLNSISLEGSILLNRVERLFAIFSLHFHMFILFTNSKPRDIVRAPYPPVILSTHRTRSIGCFAVSIYVLGIHCRASFAHALNHPVLYASLIFICDHFAHLRKARFQNIPIAFCVFSRDSPVVSAIIFPAHSIAPHIACGMYRIHGVSAAALNPTFAAAVAGTIFVSVLRYSFPVLKLAFTKPLSIASCAGL